MTVTLVLPPQLRDLLGGAPEVRLEGDLGTVGRVLAALRREAPAVYDRLLTEQHNLRPHLNVFVQGEDIRWTGGMETPVAEGSQVVFLTAVSGG